MKKLFMFIAFVLCSLCFAEKSEIKFTAIDGTVSTMSFENNAEYIVVDANKLPIKRMVDIQGFENFKNLNSVTFYFLRYSGNYDFLTKITNLKDLGLMGCWISSLSFLKDIPNLETAEIEFSADISNYEKIKNTKIDLRKLTKLKYLYLNASDFAELYEHEIWNINRICFLNFVPPFINVQNKPELRITNNEIEKISKDEIKLLKQYSRVCLDSNPIAKNETELLKLKKAEINFTARPRKK